MNRPVMAQSYKSLKEDFVSNLSGGKIPEINYTTLVAPAAVFLWSALQRHQRFFLTYSPAVFVADFLLNVGAILLAITLCSSIPITLNFVLVSPALVISLFSPPLSRQKKPHKPTSLNGTIDAPMERNSLDPLPVRPFITAYRGAMMIVTCLAILAVDFNVFPRRFAKVETWGTSLMDLGVGSFVFSAGVVSARPVLKDRLTGRTTSLVVRLFSSVKHSLPLFILGLGRVYSVKCLDLAEHVTEYGVHWNFFFTLAFLPPSMALFESFSTMVPSNTLLSILLGTTYQLLLEYTNLQTFILTAPRTDLFRQNREGVFSFFGYLAIFLAGQAAGFIVLPRGAQDRSSAKSASIQRKKLLKHLALTSTGWTILFYSTTTLFSLSVSRRLANLPYILWVAAFNCTQLLLFCAIETWAFPEVHKALDKRSEAVEAERATSKVLRVFNKNGLAIFLLANPLTGIANFTLNTLTVSRERAMSIIVIYATILTLTALALDRWNISIKL